MVESCRFVAASVALAAGVWMSQAIASEVVVGGAAMDPTRDIIDNAVTSRSHTTLIAALKAADLVATLKGPGPFTVFAPTNEAFAKLGGSVDTLLRPENKATLTKLLTYHVVPGKFTTADLVKAIHTGGGKAELRTASGGLLTSKLSGQDLVLTDEKGGSAKLTIPDALQLNGVLHVVDAVVQPR